MSSYSVALLSDTTTSRTATYIKSVLEGMGHTVTLLAKESVTASNLSGYDIIVTARFNGSEAICGYLRDYIDDGVPVIIGSPANVSTLDTPAVWLGMAAAVSFAAGRDGTYLLDANHPVTESYSPPVQIDIFSSATYLAKIYDNQDYVGTVLGQYSAADSMITLLAIPAGTNDISGNPYGANCGFIGYLYSALSITLTAAAQDIFSRFIAWCIEGGATIELADASLSLHAAGLQLDDTSLWLSATNGTVLEDLPARLEAAGYSLEDLSAPLAAYLKDLEDVPAYLTTVARVLLDAPLSLQAHALAREDLPADLRACAQRLDNLGLYLSATDAQVLHDLGLYLSATDGAVTDDLSLRLAAVRNAPRYVSSIAQRVSSVVRDVT